MHATTRSTLAICKITEALQPTFSIASDSDDELPTSHQTSQSEEEAVQASIIPKEFGSPHWTISATGSSWALRPAKGDEDSLGDDLRPWLICEAA
jgi:hypothetical protein